MTCNKQLAYLSIFAETELKSSVHVPNPHIPVNGIVGAVELLETLFSGVFL